MRGDSHVLGSSLGVEDAERRLKVIEAEEIRRMTEEQLRDYAPSPTQLRFHQSRADIRGLFGGNQGGKSYCGGNEIALTVGKVHPWRPNYTGIVYARDCCVNFNTIQTVLIPTYQRLLPRKPCILPGLTYEGKKRVWPGLRGYTWKSAWSELDKAIYLADGSFVEFKSYEQGREAFQGPVRHVIRHDEEPPEAIFNENMARQITVRRNILFTLTPLNYSEWLYAQIYEAAERSEGRIECFKMSSYENPYANEEVLKALEKDIADDAERAARLHGEFTFITGRVYKEYGKHNFIDPMPLDREWHRAVVIDAHEDKPTAVNWICESDEGKAFCYREADLQGDIKEICDQIFLLSEGEKIDLWLCDPSMRRAALIRGKGRMIDEFRKYIPRLREANNNTEIGRDKVKQLVKDDPVNGPKFYVFKTCPVTHFQMTNHSWKPPTATGESRGKPEVVKRNDDHPDNIRYWAMARPQSRFNKFYGFGVKMYAN